MDRSESVPGASETRAPGPSSPRELEDPGPPAIGSASQSLEEVHGTVAVGHPGLWRRLFAFFGPAYLVSVGYMDPGNWATDIAGGSQFRYELLWVLLLSNALAVLLQTLSSRLGIVTGRDLAQACRESYPRPVALALWVLCEIAIAATDLAEVLGTAVGLKLLFGLDPLYGVLLTGLDTFLLLAVQRLGMRKMEGFILVLVGTIGVCLVVEIVLAQPEWGEVAGGLLPPLTSTAPFLFSSQEALYVAIGILGATVMPHNLYLHSALVQTRRIDRTPEGVRRACRYNLLDSVLALNVAFVINAAILILAAATFHGLPLPAGGIDLEDAQQLLYRVLGTKVAPIAFAVALLASGQSSTLTGTLAGQVVMEGFVHLRLRPWVRRLLTRSMAIVPAVLVILLAGQKQKAITDLMVLSQVVLSLQLPFAVVPLLQFTSRRARMGAFASPPWLRILGWTAAAIIIALNVQLVTGQVGAWIEAAGPYALLLELTLLPLTAGGGLLLGWLIFGPMLASLRPPPEVLADARATARVVAANLPEPLYRRIGVALDNSRQDAVTLRHAAALARGHGAELVLVHVVEGVGGQFHGQDAADQERVADQTYLESLAEALRSQGLTARPVLRFGRPATELAQAVVDEGLDLLVLGSHGHGLLADRLFGETTGAVRHAVRIPVLTIREAPASPR